MNDLKITFGVVSALALVLISTGLKAQAGAFGSINYTSGGYYPVLVQDGMGQNIWVLGGESFSQQHFLRVAKINPANLGEAAHFWLKFNSVNFNNYFRLGADCSLYEMDSLLFLMTPIHHTQFGDKYVWVRISLLNGEYKAVGVPDYSRFIAFQDTSLVSAGASFEALIVQKRNADLELSEIRFYNYEYSSNDLLLFSDVNIKETSASGYMIYGNGYLLNKVSGYISEFDSMGNPLWGIGLPDAKLTSVCQFDNFTAGCQIIEGGIVNGQAEVIPILFLLNEQQQVLWAKHFNHPVGGNPVIGYLEGVGIVFGAYLNKFDVTLFTALGIDGSIKYQYALPGRFEIFVLKNQMLLLGKKYDSLGPNWSLHETSPSGQIGECESISSCLSFSDTLIETFSFNIDAFGAIYSDTSQFHFKVESDTLSLIEGCFEDFLSPAPAFTLDPKVCIGDTIEVIAGSLDGIDSLSWHLTGPGVDSVLTDSLGFCYVPAEPGTYTLEQTIWYLGCAYSEAHEVEVLPALELHIVPEGPACSPPLRLGLEASRPLQQVQWAHGPTAASITAQNQGWYIAHATDGTCTATDSLEVVFVDSLLAGAPALGLPPDTTVCVQDLPFVFEVTSPMADSFLLNGVREEAPLALPEGDTYTVSACIRGCCYSETYHLDTYDCAPRIYMPTAISPNGDGINDELFAQGKNFSTLRLKVFHRWGGLLHSAEGPDARWDARDAPAGTYVWLLEYRSHYDGSIQRISGEVTVLR